MKKRHYTFKIYQYIDGKWIHIIDFHTTNDGMTEETAYDSLEQFVEFIYKSEDSVRFISEVKGAIISKNNGPVKVILKKRLWKR